MAKIGDKITFGKKDEIIFIDSKSRITQDSRLKFDGKTLTVDGTPIGNPSIENPADALYIKGDEFTDGSKRITIGDDNRIQMQARANGVWNLTDLELSSNTLELGHGLDLSALADSLVVESVELGQKFIVLSIPFDNSGSTEPRVPRILPLIERLIVQPDDSTDFPSTSHTVVTTGLPFNAYFLKGYLRIGSFPASSKVTITIETGLISEGGTLYFKRNYPISQFGPADTEIEIEFGAGLGVFVGQSFVTTFKSDVAFSLKGASSGALWFGADLQLFANEEIVSFGTGTDKIITDKGNAVADSGNLVYDGAL